MKTIIIIANVDAIDRCNLDAIEGRVFDKVSDVLDEVFNLGGDMRKIFALNIGDYVDGVNNQELDNLSDNWITYVFLK